MLATEFESSTHRMDWHLVASLESSTAYVEVHDIEWFEAGEMSHCRPGPSISLLLFAPNYSVEVSTAYQRREFQSLGRVVFTPPNLQVTGRTNAGGTARLVACVFTPAYAEQLVGPLTGLSPAQLRRCLNVRTPWLQTILSQLMHEAMHPGVASAGLVESLGQAMLLECSRTVISEDRQLDNRGRLSARHFKIIDDYLATLTGEVPSVSALAAACGFSVRHFSRLFREQTQQSIGHYMRSVQISKAQAYLLGGTLPVKEIAFRLGFTSVSNFSAAFRAATGAPPAAYRSRVGAGQARAPERCLDA